MKMEQTECSEKSAYKIQTPSNYPKESIQHTEHDESLKLGIFFTICGVKELWGGQFTRFTKLTLSERNTFLFFLY